MKLHRIFTVVLAFMLLLACHALAETIGSGELETGGMWLVDDEGVLSFSGATTVDHFDIDWELRDQVVRMDIGSEVTNFNTTVLSNFRNVEAITVDPENECYAAVDGVLYDKAKATLICYPFGKMDESFAVPAGTKTIRHDAFTESKLESVTFPEGLECIEQDAFWSNDNLTEVVLPASLTKLDGSAFTLCTGMTAYRVAEGNPVFFADADGVLFARLEDSGEIALFAYPIARDGDYTVPDGVDCLSASSFSWGEYMETVTISEGVSWIGAMAFYNNLLKTVNLPKSLSSIGDDAFGQCNRLSTVNFAGTMEQWQEVGIIGDNFPLKFATIHCSDGDVEPTPVEGTVGDGITYTLTPGGELTIAGAGEWDDWAFAEIQMIRKVTLQSGVTEVGQYAFFRCPELAEVAIPDSVTEIKTEAFYYAEALKAISIPASVTAIGERAFEDSGVREVTFAGTKAEWEALVPLRVACGLEYATITCSDGVLEPLVEDDQCGDKAHYSCDEYEEGKYLWVYGEGAIYDSFFQGVEGVCFVGIQDEISAIGEESFRDMADLTQVQIAETVTSIGENAFAGCDKIEKVVFIGTHEQWDQIEIGEGNEPLLGATFRFVGDPEPQLDTLELPKDLSEIEEGAFANIDVQAVYVPYGCIRIGAEAFKGCASLVIIEIPDTVTEIGLNAFADCPNVVIEAPYGSYALEYAERYGIPSDGYGE